MSGFNSNLGQQSVYNMVLPQAPVIIPQSADMRTASEVDFDFSQPLDNGFIDFISGAWVDNSANTLALTLQVAGSQQQVIFPAGCQGYLPLLAPNNPKFIASCASVPGVIIPIIFYNVPLLPYLINTAGQPVTISGTVTVNQAAHAITDRSLTLAAGDQILCAAGQANSYLIIQNPTGNGNISINIAGGDSTVHGIVIPAGGSYELTKGVTGAVHISGTATQNVIAFAG